MIKNENLEYYVINYNFNKKHSESFNIFNNYQLEEATLKAVRKYLRAPKKYKIKSRTKDRDYIYGFDAFVEELRQLIMWQEWGRCEYEIMVNGLFDDYGDKWDCYAQCLPNIEMIAREVIYQYKTKIAKKKLKTTKTEE